MKNIPKCLVCQNDTSRVQEGDRYLLVSGAGDVEGCKIDDAVLKEALLRVVSNTNNISPRDSVHWIENTVQWVFCFFDNFLERLCIGECRVSRIGSIKELLVDVRQRVALHARLNFAKVKQRIEKEEGHGW